MQYKERVVMWKFMKETTSTKCKIYRINPSCPNCGEEHAQKDICHYFRRYLFMVYAYWWIPDEDNYFFKSRKGRKIELWLIFLHSTMKPMAGRQTILSQFPFIEFESYIFNLIQSVCRIPLRKGWFFSAEIYKRKVAELWLK